MRIEELQLLAYGNLKDTILDFRHDPGRVSLVYAPNEGGKSTSLRAILGLLYGIPLRDQAGFLHGNKTLRIGGVLSSNTHGERHFIRRKTKTDSLVTGDGTPIPDADMLLYLGATTSAAFETAYGLTHSRLRQGGADLIAGKGDLADALFQGVTGIRSARVARAALDSEAAAIWRARGACTLRVACDKHRSAMQAATAATLRHHHWDAKLKAVTRAEKEDAAAQASLAEVLADLDEVERMLAAFPHIGTIATANDELALLGHVIELPLESGQRRRDAEKQLVQADSDIADHRAQLEQLRQQASALTVPRGLLERAGEIEDLVRESAVVRQAESDLPEQITIRATQTERAEEHLARVAPGLPLAEAHTRRLTPSARGRIADLDARFSRNAALLEEARRNDTEARAALRAHVEILKAMPAPVDPVDLRSAVEAAQPIAGLVNQVRTVTESIAAAATAAETAARQLPYATLSIDALVSLAVPPEAVVDEAETDLSALNRLVDSVQQAVDTAAEELNQANAELGALLAGPVPPSDEELGEARVSRDAAWALLRPILTGGSPPADAGPVLADSFEHRVASADGTADAMLTSSTEVGRRREMEKRRQLAERRLASATQRLGDQRAAYSARWQEWMEAWKPTGIEPQSPHAMRQWLGQLGRVRALLEQASKDRVAQLSLEGEITAATCRLRSAMETHGSASSLAQDDFVTLLARATALLNAVIARRTERADAERRLLDLEQASARHSARVSELTTGLTSLSREWEEAIRPLGVPLTSLPREIAEVLKELDTVFEAMDKAADASSRVKDMTNRIRSLQDRITVLVSAVAPDLGDLAPADMADRLSVRLKEGEAALAAYATIQRTIDSLGPTLAGFQTRRDEAKRVLDDLLVLAGVADYADLPQAEERSDRYRALCTTRREAEAALGKIVPVGTVASDWLSRVAATDPSTQMAQKVQLEANADAAKTDVSEAGYRLRDAKRERDAVDDDSTAADALGNAEGALAEIRSLGDRYARLRVAVAVLDRTMKALSERNQGPVLTESSRLFSLLTRLPDGRHAQDPECVSFAGLQAGVDDDDRPVLVGTRWDGTEVTTAGMSEATLDQLYLALRLGSLAARNEPDPMPLVLDDILINFDDDRARAALQVLQEVAQKRQVLLFTHHKRMQELAAAEGLTLDVHDLRSTAS